MGYGKLTPAERKEIRRLDKLAMDTEDARVVPNIPVTVTLEEFEIWAVGYLDAVCGRIAVRRADDEPPTQANSPIYCIGYAAGQAVTLAVFNQVRERSGLPVVTQSVPDHWGTHQSPEVLAGLDAFRRVHLDGGPPDLAEPPTSIWAGVPVLEV